MAIDPRRDPRAQRAAQLAAREPRALYPSLENQEMPEEPGPTEDELYEEFVENQPGNIVIGPGMGPNRFYSDERQETTIAVDEWNENHPLWMALKRGEVRITKDAHGNEIMVDRRLDVKQDKDLFPKVDYAKADSASGDLTASLAQIKYDLSKTLTMYVSADPAMPGSPLLTTPTQSAFTNPPIGGAVFCASLEFGHKGAGQQVWFDIPAGQVVKQSFAGSFGKLTARLWPQYYTPDDVTLAPVRQYLVYPGGPVLTTETWNSVPASLMAMNGFPAMTRLAPARGWFGEGIQSLDSQSRPSRRFYGSIATDGTVASHRTRCPIAHAATYVMLLGGQFDSTAPAAQSLSFVQTLAPTSSITFPQIGPYPANTLIALDAKVQSIDVINAPNPVRNEVPFSLLYFLSF